MNTCQFCGKTFVRTSWFLRHACAKKKKFEAINDVVVQHAYRVYIHWMIFSKLIKRGKEPDFNKFMKSPKFGKFVDIIRFTKDNHITSPYTYVEWLSKNRIRETDWCNGSNDQLERFKRYSNEYEDPVDQAFDTKRYIERWIMEKPNERTIEVFTSKLTPGAILTMVRQGFLKPWPLLTYAPIADKWLGDDIYNADVFYRISDIIDCNYWADKIANDNESVEVVAEIMDELWESQT